MINYKTGNIFREEVDAIVNTVNCVGVMGRGIALQFKKAFPDNFKAYAAACKRQEVRPGKMFVYEIEQSRKPQFIINFPTKRHWREKSRMQDIETGLHSLRDEIRSRNITSIAIPPLGSGLGGLSWPDVREQIDKILQELNDVNIIVFEPGINITELHKNIRAADVPEMTAGRAALVSLINHYLGGLMDPFVTLLEIHKLMYFMQEAGEPLRLQFRKAIYGPYAENLRHVLNKVEGHFISGYADGGDQPTKEIELVPSALQKAKKFLEKKEASVTQIHLEKVARLVDGFETPFGLELLSTVHWVVKKENITLLDDVVGKVYAWNRRKKQFSKRQISIAYQVLKQQGWFDESEKVQ